jgi:hypothetical protein
LNSFTAAKEGKLASSASDSMRERRTRDVFIMNLWLAQKQEQRDT